MTNLNLYREFRAGEFTVQSTCTGFSNMSYDQALEQNKKTIKATNANGYINVVNQENEKLLRLEVCTPEIQGYLDGFEDSTRSLHVQHKEAMQ